MGRWIGSAIALVVCVACRDVEETPYEPGSTASTGDTSSSTDGSSTSSSESATSGTTDAPPDQDSMTGSSSSSSTDASTGADERLPELLCGDGFTFAEAASAIIESDDRRIIESIEITIRAEHPAFASVELAIVKDDTRRVLLAPGSVDCGGELSLYFSDAGELHAEDACFSDEPDARVLPAESLDALASSPLAGTWTLEASGDPTGGGRAAITAWCLVLRMAE